MNVNLRLTKIINKFQCGITEEQAWAICYFIMLDLRELPIPWIYKPSACKNQRDRNKDMDGEIFPSQAVVFKNTGEIHIDPRVVYSCHFDTDINSSSNFSDSDSDDICKAQKLNTINYEADLIAPIAIMLYRCLDFGIEDEMERQLSSSLTNIIEIMLGLDACYTSTEPPCFSDYDANLKFEGLYLTAPCDYEDTIDEGVASTVSFNSRPSSPSQCHSCKSNDGLISVLDVLHRCEGHYLENKDQNAECYKTKGIEAQIRLHYQSVCRELYQQYHECTLSFDDLDYKNSISQWDRIVNYIDTGNYKLRPNLDIPPRGCIQLPYRPEVSPFDAMKCQIRNFPKSQLRHVEPNVDREHITRDEDPYTKTLNMIKNRDFILRPPGERVLPDRQLVVRNVSTPHEMLMDEIQNHGKLKRVPTEMKRRYTIDLSKVVRSNKRTLRRRPKLVSASERIEFPEDEDDGLDYLNDEIHVTKKSICHTRSVSMPQAQTEVNTQAYYPDNSIDDYAWFQSNCIQFDYSNTWETTASSAGTPSEYFNEELSESSPRESIDERLRLDDFLINYQNDSNDEQLSGGESPFPSTPSKYSVFSLDMLQSDEFLFSPSQFPKSSTVEFFDSRNTLPIPRNSKIKKKISSKHRPINSPSDSNSSKREQAPLYGVGLSRLQEIAHIRDVWLQEQIANLQIDNPVLAEEAFMGRICFVCYSKFNWKRWSAQCKLCNRKICSNCKIFRSLPTSSFNTTKDFHRSQKKNDQKLLVCNTCNDFLCDYMSN